MFDMFNSPAEQYMISVYDNDTGISYTTIASDRKAFARLMEILNTEKYRIGDMVILRNHRQFAEVIAELKNEENNKPDGLNFGN
jgi:hypothetical protein